jgi:hypothetical protein
LAAPAKCSSTSNSRRSTATAMADREERVIATSRAVPPHAAAALASAPVWAWRRAAAAAVRTAWRRQQRRGARRLGEGPTCVAAVVDGRHG